MLSEWKNIIKNKFLIVLILVVSIIPSIYSNLFLDSMWTPYKNVKKLPVALINSDETVEINGIKLNIGNELVINLKASKPLNFHFLSNREEAIKGLKKGTYYMIVDINKDFSRNASSILNSNPEKMKLSYTVNPGLNYISTKIDDGVIKDLQQELVKKVQTTYINLLFSKLKDIQIKMNDLQNGISQLDDASDRLLKGQKKLDSGIEILSSGASQLSNGSSSFSDALNIYTSGVDKLSLGSKKLNNQSPLIINGGKKLLLGIEQATTKLNDGTKKIQNGIETLGNRLPNSDQIQTINNSINELERGLDLTKYGINNLVDYTQKLNDGTTKLVQASNELQKGVKEYTNGVQNNAKETEEIIKYLIDNIPIYKKPFVLPKVLEYQKKMKNINFDEASNQLNQGAEQLQKGLNQINILSHGIYGDNNSGLVALNNGINQITENYKIFKANQEQLNNGYLLLNEEIHNKLLPGITNLNNGVLEFKTKTLFAVDEFQSGLGEYTKGVSMLSTSLSQLQNNNFKMSEGFNSLHTGIDKIQNGSVSLKDGNSKLITGLDKLNQGTNIILDQIKTSNSASNNYYFEDINVDSLIKPLEIERKETSKIINNGHAMSPYMMTISLFVGALAVCMVYPLDKGKKEMKNSLVWWLSKFSILVLFAILQSTILCSSMIIFLGFQPLYVFQTFLVAFVTSLTFLSIISLLIVNYGVIGKFLTIVLLVLQLCTSEGTYPLVLSRNIYQIISPYLPATYCIKAFKEVISIDGNITMYLLVLSILILIFTALNILSLGLYRRGILGHRDKISKIVNVE